MLWKTNLKNRLRIILGPGYLHDTQKLIQNYPGLDIISNSNNMSSEIGNSSIVITALGTTLQDIEFYGKKSIIICNYENDLNDYYYIKKMSRLKSKIKCIGLWENFDKKILLDFISKMDSLEDERIDNPNYWGVSWKKLLCLNQ